MGPWVPENYCNRLVYLDNVCDKQNKVTMVQLDCHTKRFHSSLTLNTIQILVYQLRVTEMKTFRMKAATQTCYHSLNYWARND
jgi:hypothetical protein